MKDVPAQVEGLKLSDLQGLFQPKSFCASRGVLNKMVLDSVVGYYELPVPPNYHCKSPCMWVRKHGICISKVGGDLVQICPLIFVVALRKGWRFISC